MRRTNVCRLSRNRSELRLRLKRSCEKGSDRIELRCTKYRSLYSARSNVEIPATFLVTRIWRWAIDRVLVQPGIVERAPLSVSEYFRSARIFEAWRDLMWFLAER